MEGEGKRNSGNYSTIHLRLPLIPEIQTYESIDCATSYNQLWKIDEFPTRMCKFQEIFSTYSQLPNVAERIRPTNNLTIALGWFQKQTFAACMGA